MAALRQSVKYILVTYITIVQVELALLPSIATIWRKCKEFVALL